MFIKINPKSQRAKQRVKEHGNVMLLANKGFRNGKLSWLCYSLNETWNGEQWAGWFDDTEIEWDVVKDEKESQKS